VALKNYEQDFLTQLYLATSLRCDFRTRERMTTHIIVQWELGLPLWGDSSVTLNGWQRLAVFLREIRKTLREINEFIQTCFSTKGGKTQSKGALISRDNLRNLANINK